MTAGAQVKAALEQRSGLRAGAVLPRLFLPDAGEQGAAAAGQADARRASRRISAPRPGASSLHVKALEAWAAGDIMRACLHWEEVLTDAPLDLHGAQAAPHHDVLHRPQPGHAFGRVRRARRMERHRCRNTDACRACTPMPWRNAAPTKRPNAGGAQAVERNPGDLWAIHSVAHVLEMQGRSAEGVKWLDYTPEQWANKNPFKAHVWWHAALFLLAQGQNDRALDLYDKALCSVNSDTYVDVSNQAALLKRIEMSGVDVGERWQALAEHSEKRIHDHMLPFRDAHFCLALAANGNFEAARQHIESMAAFSGAGRRLAGRGHARHPHSAVRRHDRLRGGRLRQGDRPVLAAAARHRRRSAAAMRSATCSRRSCVTRRCTAASGRLRAACCRSGC